MERKKYTWDTPADENKYDPTLYQPIQDTETWQSFMGTDAHLQSDQKPYKSVEVSTRISHQQKKEEKRAIQNYRRVLRRG